MLLHLLDRAPDVVSIDALLSRTWRDVVVGDNVVHQAIAQLRKALGDEARHPRFVKLCAKLGLCDYWVRTERWPDCPNELAPFYDFRAEARRHVA